jgi:hypothetical protein
MVLFVENVDWAKLKKEILTQKSFIDKYGDGCKEISLGKASDLTPSCKHHNFGRPARNLEAQGSYKGYVKVPELLTRPVDKPEQEDSDWWRDLIKQGKKHKIYIKPSGKDRSFIVAGIKIKDRSET